MVFRNLLVTEMNKTEVKIDKPVYLGLSILDISKAAMYEYLHDYIKPKYGNKANLCCTDTDSFIIHVKSEEIYGDLAGDVEKRFDTSNYEVNRPLPIGKSKIRAGLMKDELDGKIMKEIVSLEM